MARFSIRRIIALTAYCAVATVAVANPLLGTTVWRIPVWIGPASVFCLPFFAWFVLFGSRRRWLRFAQVVSFALGGMALGVLFFESPLPGALAGLLAAGTLIRLLSRAGKDNRRNVVRGFCLVITVIVIVCAGLTWRHHVAKHVIRRSGGSVSWRPRILSIMPSRTKAVATALGPYLVPSDTFVSFRDDAKNSRRSAFHGSSLNRLRPHLESIHGLNHLYVTSHDFGNDDAKQLIGLTKLTHLHLGNTKLTDVTPLAELKSLEELSLQGSSVSDLTPLSGMTSLRRLGLNRTQVGDVRPLSGMTRLKELYLAGTRVSDVTALAGLTNLETLWLQDTQVSDVTVLAELTKLRYLRLSNTRVATATALSRLVKLRRLDLRAAKVNAEEIQRLKRALPRCQINE